MSALGAVLDDVIARYAGGAYEAEAARARAAFVEATGRVFDDDPMFEERMGAFLEWFVLERPMDTADLRPIDRYRREVALEPAAQGLADALAASHWSLFEVLELGNGRAQVEDLLAGGRFVVHERRKLTAIETGDVFEARLVSVEGRTRFGRSFCFHPREATATIRRSVAEAARRGQRKEDVLFRLAERRLRCERYHNVHIARLYATP